MKGLHVIQFPSGNFGFVGKVPVELAYEGPARDIETGRKFGFGLVRNTVRQITYTTAEAARDAAEKAGYACS